MLQVNDGFLVFPVGLDDHALDGTTDHAEGTGLFLDNAETLLALQAATLPLLVAQIDRLIRDRQLGAKLDVYKRQELGGAGVLRVLEQASVLGGRERLVQVCLLYTSPQR